MAIKISSTTVFNNNNAIDWTLISSKPQYVGSLIKTNIGDNTLTTTAPASNVAYHSANNTLQIWFDTNCACVCVCDCGVGCFLGSEKVWLNNGTTKRLDDIKIGDIVSCFFNKQARVLGIRQTFVKHNKMYRINKNIITTGEHGFWSADSNRWLVCDKTNDLRDIYPWRKIISNNDGREENWHFPQGLNSRQMLIGDKILVNNQSIVVNSIDKVDWLSGDTKLYTLVTTSSFILNEGWVVTGWAGSDFDKPIDIDYDRRLKKLRGEISQKTPYRSSINLGSKDVYIIR